jgi:NAD(P)-dependent dehydrogenase (short-subunit alcohol dehydrogenase family)
MTGASDRFDLSHKVAVVTGGSRGLGRAIVTAFADAGADVVIASRKLDACEAVAADIRHRTGRLAQAVQFHAGQWDAAERLVETIYDSYGRCDILVNNAGMSPLYPSLTEVTETLFDKVMGVNFKGVFRTSVLVGSRMAEGAGGSIINVSSVSAIQPGATDLVYACAKAAMNALTAGLARSFGPTVRCNGIMPGPFLTDISKAWDTAAFELTSRERIPLGRGGQPEEIVGAALYLASSASSYTTGSIIKVDGGLSFGHA